MSVSPIENLGSLRIGSVEYVSTDEIKIALDIEAPDSLAANAGIPRAFPRINSYVLIASESGYLVSQIEWIAFERAQLPKRKDFHDYGLIDLPFPLRKMSLSPLGVLKNDHGKLLFQRGVQTYPSVGEPVLIPTDEQLRAIVESGKNRRVKIGTSPLAANAEVYVDPDRLFGRHLAVLGNTGSGKSCSVAGLIRWSVEAAVTEEHRHPNARFVVLDPNGEYAKAFTDIGKVFRVEDPTNPLQVPLWFWNSSEWCSFMQASAKTQTPLLRRALRAMRNEIFEVDANKKIEAKRFIGIILQSLRTSKSSGEPFARFPHNMNFNERLSKWKISVDSFNNEIEENLDSTSELIDKLLRLHVIPNGQYNNYVTYTVDEVNELISELEAIHVLLGGTEQDLLPQNEDVPVKFSGDVFVKYLEALAQDTGNEQYIEFLLARIQTMLADTRMKSIIGDNTDITLKQWISDYLGSGATQEKCVTIIDLSLVPAEIVNIVASVIARITFETLQRYRKQYGVSLPTVLVMEEAHTFVKRYKDDVDNQSASSVCCQTFERIAREGRKYGLGLILSSQRPSELSPTVLSQCNTFLLHRITNDRDQELVQKLVPDNLRGLLRELPSLPSQQAILLGWASELPIMVRMNDLEENKRPQSEDPAFWKVWTGEEQRLIDWDPVIDEWLQKETRREP